MKKITLRIILMTILIWTVMACIGIFSYGTNEEVENNGLVIVKDTETNKYIIYIKGYLEQEFEFAFSNAKEVTDISTLSFITSALDAPEEGANNIAYVDSTNIAVFENPTYMWIKVNDEVKISAREIKLEDNITKTDLEKVGKTSKIVPISLEQKQIVNETNEEGTKITETVGIVNVLKEITNGKYKLLRRETSEDTERLFALAELIEKNEFTDSYTKIKASKEFIELYNEQYNSLSEEKWNTVTDYTIEQPIDAQTGDQYILWLKGDNIEDVHFLTSYRQYEEEYIKEEITTKLPYTYDDNTILIVLGIVLIVIALIIIRIAMLKKKDKRRDE